ncbi:MAG: vitamin K epoxide reductase family protein [Pseudonocardiaceae bacterium]
MRESTGRSTGNPAGAEVRWLAWLLVVGGSIGTVVSGALLVEKIALLQDPAYVPSCSINPVLSCGSVMSTEQAAVFGFPNPVLGVTGFAVVTTVGTALLAGASFHRWFWLGLQSGTIAGAGFVHWLIFQSLYRIGALCPYCMAVWTVTIPVFWYVTLFAVSAGHLPVPASARRVVGILAGYHGVVLTGWFLLVVVLVTQRFWSLWSALLS